MKKITTLAVLLLCFGSLAWAYDFSAVSPSGQTLCYNINSGTTTVTTVSNSGISGSLTIPSSVTYNRQTYTVTAIGMNAFYWCTGLTSVTIPNTVTSIGNSAFYWCTGLTSVTMGSSVTTIGRNAFSDCSSLTSITLPSSVTSLGNSAFYGCSSLDSIVIPNLITAIGSSTFYNCTSLASVTLPSSLTSIGNNAFNACTSLTSIAIPDSVTTIGDNAFNSCSALSSITLPNLVATIGYRAFYGVSCVLYCGNATGSPWGAVVAGCFYTEGDFVYTDSTKTELRRYIGADSVVAIPNSVTTIGSSAFYGCSGVVSVTLGDSVTAIGSNAFSGCTGLASITSNAAVAPTLGSNAFSGVSSAISVNISCGSLASYSSVWSCFSNFVEGAGFLLSVASADSTNGTVRVLAAPTCANPSATINAVADSGFLFDHWSNGTQANPYTLTLTQDTTLTAYFVVGRLRIDTVYVHDTTIAYVHDTTYVPVHDTTYIPVHDTTYVPVHDTTYIAIHDTTYIAVHDTTTVVVHDTLLRDYTFYTLSVSSDNVQLGVAAGNGHFPDSTEVEIAAIPIAGSRFVQWQDGNTDNPRRVRLLGSDASYVAVFAAGAESVTEINAAGATITSDGNRIIVGNAANQRIRIFDSMGRLLATHHNSAEVQVFSMSAAGVYLVQTGDGAAQKVVVKR